MKSSILLLGNWLVSLISNNIHHPENLRREMLQNVIEIFSLNLFRGNWGVSAKFRIVLCIVPCTFGRTQYMFPPLSERNPQYHLSDFFDPLGHILRKIKWGQAQMFTGTGQSSGNLMLKCEHRSGDGAGSLLSLLGCNCFYNGCYKIIQNAIFTFSVTPFFLVKAKTLYRFLSVSEYQLLM